MKLSHLKSTLLGSLGLLVLSHSIQAVERVVATVNNVPILSSEVSKQLKGKTLTEQNQKKALEQVIDDILVKQALKNKGIKISNTQIDHVIENIAFQNGITFGQLLDALDYQGIDYYQYRNQIAHQLMMNELHNYTIGKTIDISREQIDGLAKQLSQLNQNQGKKEYVEGTEYEVRHILVTTSPILNDLQAKTLLNQIQTDILQKKISFATAAKKYSKDYLSGSKGGNLGYMVADSYVPEFQKVVESIGKGKISSPFKTKFGWHILEVTNSRKIDRTKDAYRQKAYQQLINQHLQAQSDNWVKGLRKDADIKYL